MGMSTDVRCYCGSPASLCDNATVYGRQYGRGKMWLCECWPQCDGRVGAHPDGRPLGTLADAETRRLRMQLHGVIDPRWRQLMDEGRSKRQARSEVYAWLGQLMGSDDFHVGNLNADECRRALALIDAVQ